MKLQVEHIFGAIVLGVLSWGSLQIYEMNAQLLLVSYRVEENYNMIKPMWQDFLVRVEPVHVSK